RGLSPPSRQVRHHGEPDSASHGATRHAWRTTKTTRYGGYFIVHRNHQYSPALLSSVSQSFVDHLSMFWMA
ncbi:hypothetical protein, partial [Pseudomonas sp. AU12215]|uniref:hypothetical protein n=1 Tax=Pseudomonas sp. AU12215 TaxID=1860123 RepID=UPI001C4000D6